MHMSFEAITCKIFACNQTYLGYLGEAISLQRYLIELEWKSCCYFSE